MNEKGRQTLPARGSRWMKPLMTTAFLVLVAMFIWSQLPSGAYPTDLSRIGQGRPALVLAYDPNYAGGGRVMEIMNVIRDDYEDRMDFLVAHLGDARGEAFAEAHVVGDGSVLIFTADGSRAATLHRPQTERELRAALDAALLR